MATEFSEIYNKAIFRFSDYSFLDCYPEAKREVALQAYLLSAISDFRHSSEVNLDDYDLEQETFNITLDNEVQEILALGISFYWVSSKVLNSELLKNMISHKDFVTYSPANLLKEMQELRRTLGREFRGRINEYSFRKGSLGTLKTSK